MMLRSRSNHLVWGTLLLALVLTPAAALAQQNQALLKQVEDALKAKNTGAVHDLGKLLKPGGVKEMEQQADQFRKDGMNLYFVTVPRGSTNVDALTEKVYADLNGAPSDILIVFDGQRAYAKTKALAGRPQAFKEALEEAKPGFKQYFAKGLVQFAEGIRKRAKGQKTEAPVENPPVASAAPVDQGAPPSGIGFAPIAAGAAGLLLVGGGAVALTQAGKRRSGMSDYNGTLHAAEAVYNRITLEMPDPAPADVNREWMRLDEKLQRARARKASLAEVVDLHSDLQDLEKKLRA